MIAISSVVWADEIPTPNGVVTIENPTLNGTPFFAMSAFEYYNEAFNGYDTRPGLAEQGRLLCRFLGHRKLFTYSVVFLPVQNVDVLFVDINLVAHPSKSEVYTVDNKLYFTSVFSKISCFR